MERMWEGVTKREVDALVNHHSQSKERTMNTNNAQHTPGPKSNLIVRECGCEYDGRGWFRECRLHAQARSMFELIKAARMHGMLWATTFEDDARAILRAVKGESGV